MSNGPSDDVRHVTGLSAESTSQRASPPGRWRRSLLLGMLAAVWWSDVGLAPTSSVRSPAFHPIRLVMACRAMSLYLTTRHFTIIKVPDTSVVRVQAQARHGHLPSPEPALPRSPTSMRNDYQALVGGAWWQTTALEPAAGKTVEGLAYTHPRQTSPRFQTARMAWC
jgi:hypothetical protein